MKPEKIRRRLEKALASGRPVWMWSKHLQERYDGFVVGLSDRWVMLESLDGFVPDGFELIRLRNLERVEIDGPEAVRWHEKVLTEYPRLGPAPFSLPERLSTRRAIELASGVAPLVGIHEEDALLIGKVLRLEDKTYDLHFITPHGAWDPEPRTYRFKDVTRIAVGDRYMKILATHGDPYPET